MLGVSTLAVTFLILVFSEITPKVIGANHANYLACIVSYPLSALLRGLYFIVWFVNLFVAGLLRVLRLRNNNGQAAHSLSTEELRTMVLESGTFIPPKHRSILLNLFELEDITVEDVMTPDPYTVTPQTAVDDVVLEMAEHKYGCAIVKQENGKVVGIFTATDGLRVLGEVLKGNFKPIQH